MSHPSTTPNPPSGPRAFDATSKLVAVVIGVVSAVAGLVVGINNPFLNRAASSEGALIDALFSVTLGVATVVFVIVQGFLLYAIIRFNRRPDDDSDGPPIRGNHKLEFFWTVIPALVIVFIGILSYQVLADIERPRSDTLVVEGTGLQYAWQFYYPEDDITSAELHIPLDRQVQLKLHSLDVIHAFWVPEFRIKKDVMPDRVTETYITGTQLGSYPIVCTELCGAGHAIMRSQVIVQSDAEYRAWIASMKQTPTGAATESDPLAAGRRVFITAGCNACHALADAGSQAVLGPSLDDIAARAGSTVPGQAADAYIRTSIEKPAEYLAPGYQDLMPKDYALRLSAQDLDVLVQYLLEMK